MKSEFEDGRVRLGRGIVFHIAPSNVPVNSAFTYVFGLLAGNANIVRVSSKEFEQVKVICNVMQEMFDSGNYERVREMTAFVSYGRDTEINDEFSKMADVRIIWGGDRTISEIRKSPISSKCTKLLLLIATHLAFLMQKKFVVPLMKRLENWQKNFIMTHI